MDTQTLTSPPAAAGTTRSTLARALLAPVSGRTWAETLHLVLNLPVGIAGFTLVVIGLSLGSGC